MIRRAVFVVAFMLAASSPASARSPDAQTVNGALLCLLPYQLKEAQAAAKQNNRKWLTEIGCVSLKGGLKAVLIDPNAPLGRPWQVRLYTPNAPDGITLWGWADAFKDAHGKPF